VNWEENRSGKEWNKVMALLADTNVVYCNMREGTYFLHSLCCLPVALLTLDKGKGRGHFKKLRHELN
jgi:hypothetical protein